MMNQIFILYNIIIQYNYLFNFKGKIKEFNKKINIDIEGKKEPVEVEISDKLFPKLVLIAIVIFIIFQKLMKINIFKNIKENKKQKIIINKIYDEYCFDKINKMRNIFYNPENNSEYSKKEKIRQISNLSKETESDIINEINYNEEDIIFNKIKECFNKLYK